MRRGVVMADAAFEAVLGTVLLLGWMFGDIDQDDFPSPGTDMVLVVFAIGLMLFAWLLAELVKREALPDPLLTGLATGNLSFATLLAVWAVVGDDFTTVGEAVVWTTAVALLILAATQALAVVRR